MSRLPKQQAAVDALRVAEADLRPLLSELDDESGRPKNAGKRAHGRLAYRVTGGLEIKVEHPGGATGRFVIRPHDISAGGLGFLHGAFLHQGTRCLVTLETYDGEKAAVQGGVVQCRCLRGRIHYMGMQFDEPIDVGNFVRLDETTAEDGEESPGYDAGRVLPIVQDLEAIIVRQGPAALVFGKLNELSQALGD